MKKYIFLMLFATQVFYAQGGFEKGNNLYRAEKYAEAVEAYESVLKSNQHSADLYFNLGNAYYKLNKTAPAIYNLEKALLLRPNNVEIANNLAFAHKMMIDEVKDVPKVGYSKIVHEFTSAFDYDSWAYIAVGLAFTFLLFFCGYYFSGTAVAKRIFFIGMFVLIAFLAISLAAAAFEKDRYATERPAIVFASSAQVRSEPKASAAEASILHEGTKVYVLESLDNWKRVYLPDGSDGWMSTGDIKELK